MKPMKPKKSKSWQLALCGLSAALSVVLMLLGAVLPLFMYISPAAAGILVMLVCVECGRTMAVTLYAAIGLLSLLFVPDKEIALVFIFLLGYYPLVKARFDKIRAGWLRGFCKLIYFNAAIAAMYGFVLLLFPAGAISAGLAEAGVALGAVTLLIGNISFTLYDKALINLLRVYRLVWQARLYRMIGRG